MAIDFSKLKAKSFKTADLEARRQEIAEERDTNRFFKPGEYEVFVTQVEILGPAKGDATWLNTRIHVKGIKDKTAKGWMLVPTDDYLYGEKKVTGPWDAFSGLAQALGLEGRLETLGHDAETLFGDDGKRLLGARLKVLIGYTDNYVDRYRTPEGAWNYRLYNSRGQPYLDNGKELTFVDLPALKAFQAASKHIRVQSFPGIIKFSASATPTNLNNPVLENF